MVKVVIVDTGVITDLLNETNGVSLLNNTISSDYEDTYGHGTAIYGILRKTKDIADIFIVKVSDNETEITENELIFSLDYIYNNLDPDIINISLGLNIVNDSEKLYRICKKLTDKGIIIVSAFDNLGAISYPAAFDNVIGVTTGDHCHKTTDFEYNESCICNIAAKGNTQRLLWTSPKIILLGGNSFACAHVTTELIKAISFGLKTKEELLDHIKNKAICVYHNNFIFENNTPDFKIRKAVLFPFSKEMHALIRFSDLLNFSIVDIFSDKYSFYNGRKVSDVLVNYDKTDYTIKSIESINLDDFDTIILGHMDYLEELKIDYNALIEKCMNENKNIFSFEKITICEKYKNYYYPNVTLNHLPQKQFGKLYRISKPVLGIFGTSSKQGKFTLQLEIRKRLLSLGYEVGQIGSEPNSFLFGMDYTFPFGYNSTVEIKEFDIIHYLNYLMNDLANKNDIIIVGSQSGTIPYDFGNLSQYPLQQYSFLLGTQPDAVVLCVNPFDSIEYIRKTLSFIESSSDSKVIALVMFPLDYEDDWKGAFGKKKVLSESEISLLLDKYSYEFEIKAFKLDDKEHIDILINEIIGFFS